MKKSDNETTTANSQPRQDGPELVGAEEAPALPPGFATAVGGGKGGSTTNQTSLLKDKKAKAKKRDKNEIVRPGAQAVQAPAPTTTTMGLEVVSEGPSPAPSELVRGTNNNSKSSANNATSNDTYFTRLGKKTAKESNQSKIAAKNKPPLPLPSMTPPPSTNTNTTSFINAEVEPINNAPRPTPLVLEEEFAPAPTWHDANVLQQRVTAMDRMSAVNLDIEQEQRHRHDQHNNQHQYPRQQPGDVENQGPATPHRGFPFYDSFRKRRSSSQLRLALCCIINLILVAVVIALSIKIATDKCPEIEGASSNKIQSDSSTTAGGGDTTAGGTTDGTATDATTESTATSTSDLPSICLASKFETSLFPENSTITTTCMNGCNIRMAIHKDHSIISVNNNLHFFSFQNKTWEEVMTVEMHSSNTDMPLSLYGNVAVVGAPYETKDTTSGAAYIFEREDGTGAWKQVDQFEKGWEDGDIEMEAGTIKWFGQTVAVHESEL